MTVSIDSTKLKCPTGYEIFDIRLPKKGEQFCKFISPEWKGNVSVLSVSTDYTSDIYPIIRKIFEWPDWVKPGTWLFKGNDGNWWFSFNKPQWFKNYWWTDTSHYQVDMFHIIDLSALDHLPIEYCRLQKVE